MVDNGMYEVAHDNFANSVKNDLYNRHMENFMNPSKEVILLNAIKPFIEDSKHDNINKMIDMMHFMNIMKNKN